MELWSGYKFLISQVCGFKVLFLWINLLGFWKKFLWSPACPTHWSDAALDSCEAAATLPHLLLNHNFSHYNTISGEASQRKARLYSHWIPCFKTCLCTDFRFATILNVLELKEKRRWSKHCGYFHWYKLCRWRKLKWEVCDFSAVVFFKFLLNCLLKWSWQLFIGW